MKQTVNILKMMSLLLVAALTLTVSSCGDDDAPTFVNPNSGDADAAAAQGNTTTVTISLDGIAEGVSAEGIEVQLRNISTGSIFTQYADATGTAVFHVVPGIYEGTATGTSSVDGYLYTFNGNLGQIVVKENEAASVRIEMKSGRKGQIIIKELYNGGCSKDDGKSFQFDKCVILYNNSSQRVSAANLCFGFASPANAQANNKNYGEDGKLVYEAAGFIPAWHGIWYFPDTLTIEPYSQIVVNICGAIDNTLTVSNSVNYANAEYYCMYDPESGYNNPNYYPTPSEKIPTSHYLKAVELGLGNGWTFSVSSPAMILFQTKDVKPADYATNTANMWYDGGNEGNQVWACTKVHNEWIIDGIEVFAAAYKEGGDCVKRLTSDIDAGYVWLTNYQGHTLYRNVDKEATEALPENAGKLVYSYSLGVDSSTDPSGINAEASIKNGAHIVFMDTNNSSNDFHERQRCSLKD